MSNDFPSKQEDVTFYDVEVLKVSRKAMLCKIFDDTYWIPFSHVKKKETEVWTIGDCGSLCITEWIAAEKGLI